MLLIWYFRYLSIFSWRIQTLTPFWTKRIGKKFENVVTSFRERSIIDQNSHTINQCTFSPFSMHVCKLSPSKSSLTICLVRLSKDLNLFIWVLLQSNYKVDVTCQGNYREIYAPLDDHIPVISKIMEKAVNSQLLCNSQFGYRKNRSTKLATTLLLDRIRKETDKGNMSGVVFIDLSKAFDTLGHSLPNYDLMALNGLRANGLLTTCLEGLSVSKLIINYPTLIQSTVEYHKGQS